MAEYQGCGLCNRKRHSDDAELLIAKKVKNDLFVSAGNSLSRQMLEPFGENELDPISLDQLWKKACVGHDYCQRFTEYAIANDKNYPALAIAKSMKNLALGVQNAIDDNCGQLLDPKVYETMKTEANELLPHLRVLSGGKCGRKRPS